MKSPEKILFLCLAGICAAVLSGCETQRYAREIPLGDVRALARYEIETSHGDTRVSGYAEDSAWLHFVPEAQETTGGYFSDIGSLFSGLSPVQSLALRAAVADACRKSGADFLLLPRYDMKTVSAWFLYESAECTVSGYPVKIEKIRQVPLTSREAEDEEVPVRTLSL
ncbi:MAG: hypothetical protein ACI4P3_03345 [Candidatus Spyradosoma sp.]